MKLDSKSAQWVAKDALKELTDEAQLDRPRQKTQCSMVRLDPRWTNPDGHKVRPYLQ